jgi:hypothetical protein
VCIERLRELAKLVALAERHEQPSVAREHEPRAEVVSSGLRQLLTKDDLQDLQLAIVGRELRARNARASGTAAPRLRIRKIDVAIARKLGVDRDIEQAPLLDRVHFRHAADRLADATIESHDSQTPWLLGHEHALVGQERHAPWMIKSSRSDRHARRCVARHYAVRLRRRAGVCRCIRTGRTGRDGEAGYKGQ